MRVARRVLKQVWRRLREAKPLSLLRSARAFWSAAFRFAADATDTNPAHDANALHDNESNDANEST
jgi:hypothetical protein